MHLLDFHIDDQVSLASGTCDQLVGWQKIVISLSLSCISLPYSLLRLLLLS